MLKKVGRFLFSPIRHWRISLIILIVLGIVYKVADQVLLTKLAARREAIVAAGGRLSFREFDSKIAPEDNAAAVYAYAVTLLRKTEGWKWEDDYERYLRNCPCVCSDSSLEDNGDPEKHALPLTTEEEARLGSFIESSREAFAAFEDAFRRDSCQFINYSALPEVLTDASALNTLVDLAKVRQLARLAAVRAVWEGRHGNVAEAYHWVTVGLHMANGLTGDPLLLNGMVSVAISSIMLRAFNGVLCVTQFAQPFPSDLLAELTVVADRLKAARFFEGERCFSNAIRVQFGQTLLRPWLTLNEMATLDMTTELIDLMSEPNDALHAARAMELAHRIKLQPGQPKLTLLNQHRILAEIIRPALEASVLGFDRGVALARSALIVVALKQCKAEQGAYPAALEALSPQYSKTLPVDPFSGGAFHYRREGDGFVLYSVGQDGRDDGGKRGRKGAGDQVWCLTN